MTECVLRMGVAVGRLPKVKSIPKPFCSTGEKDMKSYAAAVSAWGEELTHRAKEIEKKASSRKLDY